MISSIDYAKMDRLALDFLFDYSLFSFPIDVFGIASKIFRAELIPYSSLNNLAKEFVNSKKALDTGFTITEKLSDGNNVYKIYYNDSNNYYRQRFTVAHELKHILIGENDFSNDSEILADYFAKALQAPKCMLICFPVDSIEDCVSKYSLSYEASGYWIKAVERRIYSVGRDLFDYERNYVIHYLNFNKNKKD